MQLLSNEYFFSLPGLKKNCDSLETQQKISLRVAGAPHLLDDHFSKELNHKEALQGTQKSLLALATHT
jgi:hypothetical protein